MTFRPPIIVTIYPPRKVASETYNVTISALYAPNPKQPFTQTDWPRPQGPGKVQASDAPANLFPTFHPNPAQPFVQALWEGPARPWLKVPSETVGGAIGAVAPPRPFKQTDWLLAATLRQKIPDTSFAASLPLYAPNPAQPFAQNLWELARPAQPKSTAEAIGTLSPLLTPNPAQPFVNATEIRIFGLPPIKSDIVVNLLPLQATPIVVPPFAQGDWPLATNARGKIGADTLSLSLPLNFPNPSQPFNLSDWRNPAQPIRIDNAPFVPYNLSIATFIPPAVTTTPRSHPFFPTMTQLMHRH